MTTHSYASALVLTFGLITGSTGVAAAPMTQGPAADAPRAQTPNAHTPRRIAQADRQRGKQGRKKRKGGRGGKLTPEERQQLEDKVGRKMDTFITVELSSQLGLSDDKALKLARLLKQERQRKYTTRVKARQEYKALQELLDQGGDDRALKAQTRKVVEAAQVADAPPDLLAMTAGFLNAKEQARLVLVMPHVRREMRHLMKRARKEARQEAKRDGRRRHRGNRGQGGPGGFEGMDDDF